MQASPDAPNLAVPFVANGEPNSVGTQLWMLSLNLSYPSHARTAAQTLRPSPTGCPLRRTRRRWRRPSQAAINSARI